MLSGTTMARPKKISRTVTVRITEEAHRWAQVASGYTGETIVDYISRVIAEKGKADAIDLHAQMTGETKRRPKGE